LLKYVDEICEKSSSEGLMSARTCANIQHMEEMICSQDIVTRRIVI